MKLFDKVLFAYVIVLSILLATNTFSGGLTTTNMIMAALFLPVTLYILLQTIQRFRHWQYSRNNPVSPYATRKSGASGKNTTHQHTFHVENSLGFIITIFLWCLLTVAVISKAYQMSRPEIPTQPRATEVQS